MMLTCTEPTSIRPGPPTHAKLAAVGAHPETVFDGRRLLIPFFGTGYTLTPAEIHGPEGDPPPANITEILKNYVWNYPETPPSGGRQVSFRELEGAGPLVVNFANNTNKTIMATFTGKLSALQSAARVLGGHPLPVIAGFGLSIKFTALPGIPLYLQFNDAEAPFPAQSSLLLDASIETYLDMRTIFTIGTFLCGRLTAGYDREC